MKNLINISSTKMMLATIAFSLVVTGCGEEDKDNDGNHIPDVNIVQSNKTVDIDAKVKLNSTAFDVDGDDLTYKWSFTSKPEGSSATLTTNTTKKASFTPDKKGKYVVKFTAKDVVDTIGKDTVTITAKEVGNVSNTCTNYIELSNSVTTDTTLNDKCYKVTSNISVSNNALLTINAGTVLLFEDGTGINISSTGALKAVGTASKPILFTGVQKTAGYWNGIHYTYSNNQKNELAYTTIEYAGSNGYANLLLDSSSDNPSRIKLNNVTLRHGLKHGFWFDNGSIISSFKSVTSTKNKLTAGLLYADTLKSLDSTSNFKGNLGDDYITLMSSSIKEKATWKTLTVPVYVKGSINVYHELIVQAGSTFIFESGIGLTINAEGSLNAIGTKSKPILFTGVQKTAGYWLGLRYTYSNNEKNTLAYTTIEYAGGNGYANLLLDSGSDNPSRIKLNNVTLQHGLKHGFWFDKGSILSSFKSVTSTKNKLTAGLLYADTLKSLDSTSNFKGNLGDNYITLMSSSIKEKATWKALTVPIYVKGSINVYHELIVQAGSTFIFESGIGFTINAEGSLNAIGTKSKPIVFTGKQETAGYWLGLRYLYSNNLKNKLDYVTIAYGGGSGYANLTLDSASNNPSRLMVTNSTFKNSSTYAIWLDKYSIVNTEIDSDNNFSNNKKGTIKNN